jgi:hypothetical protein
LYRCTKPNQFYQTSQFEDLRQNKRRPVNAGDKDELSGYLPNNTAVQWTGSYDKAVKSNHNSRGNVKSAAGLKDNIMKGEPYNRVLNPNNAAFYSKIRLKTSQLTKFSTDNLSLVNFLLLKQKNLPLVSNRVAGAEGSLEKMAADMPQFNPNVMILNKDRTMKNAFLVKGNSSNENGLRGPKSGRDRLSNSKKKMAFKLYQNC